MGGGCESGEEEKWGRVWEWGRGKMGEECGSGEDEKWGEDVEEDSTKARIESHNYQFSYNIFIHNRDGLKLYSYTQLHKLVG